MLRHFDRERLIWDSAICPTQKLVLLAINQFLGANDCCWPAIGTIAKMTGYNDRTVTAHINQLVTKGLVVKIPRRNESGMQITNNYRLNWQKFGGDPGSSRPDLNAPLENKDYSNNNENSGVIVDQGGGDLRSPYLIHRSDLSNSNKREREEKELSLPQSSTRLNVIAEKPTPIKKNELKAAPTPYRSSPAIPLPHDTLSAMFQKEHAPWFPIVGDLSSLDDGFVGFIQSYLKGRGAYEKIAPTPVNAKMFIRKYLKNPRGSEARQSDIANLTDLWDEYIAKSAASSNAPLNAASTDPRLEALLAGEGKHYDLNSLTYEEAIAYIADCKRMKWGRRDAA